MEAKMKGLLKGLRYISQIFDGTDEKEPEMQIGFPTDVKHVAHIGCDGPSVNNSPGWMTEFRQGQPAADGDRGGGDPQAKQRNPSDPPLQGDVDSPGREGSSSNRPSRRNQPSGTASAANSRSREVSDGVKQGRRNRSAAGADPSGSDPSAASKQTNRRKAKGSSSSGGAPTKSSSSGAKGGSRLASGSGAEESGNPD